MKTLRKADHLTQEEIVEWLRDMRGNPHVPGSGYDVSLVFKVQAGGENYYFAGVNAENVDNRIGTHGEEGGIAAMVTGLGNQAVITEGWVMGAPKGITAPSNDPLANGKVPCCGNCRQRIIGLAANKNIKIHAVSLNGDEETSTIGELLPGDFSFRDFAPELAADQTKKTATPPLAAKDVVKRIMRKGRNLSMKAIFNWVSSLESVDFASKTSHAVVLKLGNGWYVAGVKTEDAAYTGTNAVQSALAIATAEFGEITVEEIWSFSKGREEKTFSDDVVQPLPLSAVQVLNEFAEGRDIPVTLFAASGETMSMVLSETVKYPLTFDQPYMRLAIVM